MSNDFIPDNDDGGGRAGKDRYVNVKDWKEVTKDGQKMKIFRARIISRKSQGWEVWSTDDKPHRGRTKDDIAHLPLRDDKFNHGQKEQPKEVIAYLVLDIEADTEKLFPIHQWGIRKGLASEMTEWGVPQSGEVFDYDFLFIQRKDKGKTVYEVKVADAAKGTAKYALKPEQVERIAALKAAGLNLDAYWDGGDPFPSAPAASDSGANAGSSDDLPF